MRLWNWTKDFGNGYGNMDMEVKYVQDIVEYFHVSQLSKLILSKMVYE